MRRHSGSQTLCASVLLCAYVSLVASRHTAVSDAPQRFITLGAQNSTATSPLYRISDQADESREANQHTRSSAAKHDTTPVMQPIAASPQPAKASIDSRTRTAAAAAATSKQTGRVLPLTMLPIKPTAENSSTTPRPPAQSSLVVNYSTVVRPGSEISTSVLIYGFSDMEGDSWSPCEMAVNNSLGFNARKINFVLTVFAIWGERKIDGYFFKDLSDYRGSLIEANNSTIERWQAGLTRCFKAAVDAGFTTLHVVLHANFIQQELHGKTLWRNTVKFNPAARLGFRLVDGILTYDEVTGLFMFHYDEVFYGLDATHPAWTSLMSSKSGPSNDTSHTYSEVLLQPASKALNAVVSNETVVEMALGGEQGLSVFGYPKAYSDMIDEAKQLIPTAKKVLTGVSFNYDKVCGCVEPEERDPIVYNTTYWDRMVNFTRNWGFARVDAPGVRQLLHKSDFIGLSSYAPLPASLSPEAMEVSIQTAAFEFLYFGIDLKRLLFVEGKQLIYSEQGLGGLTDNGRLAPSLDYIRRHPYSGAGPAYSAKLDPWQVPEFRDFRRNLYRVLANWAAAGGGPQYRIDGIYLWSMGTWDVHAAHPLSLGRNASYGDPIIQDYIREANAKVNGDFLDEISNIKPLINGTREYIIPPWLRVTPPPAKQPAKPPQKQSSVSAAGTQIAMTASHKPSHSQIRPTPKHQLAPKA